MTNPLHFLVIYALCFIVTFGGYHYSFAQDKDELEINLDLAAANSIPLPKIFKPNIDLSGRGFHKETVWPQTVADKDLLDIWERDIGFGGIFRMQYSLWEIGQLSQDPDLQTKLIANYEDIMEKITKAGGIVILDIFGTPAGLGKVLNKKSAPRDLRAFKELVKRTIRRLSCNKRYNVWYEVWSAPDLEEFFLGKEQEYFNLYRMVALSVKELKAETKIHIPVGGPSVSWWFQNQDGNTILTPERSLIYEFIKFCYRYQLPLDFITWHGYSTDPQTEKQNTIYKKTAISLIRDWLSYFRFPQDTALIVDEWNYDRGFNILPERQKDSFISASYIPSRIKNMYEAGIDYQLYFCLEDFKDNKEGVARNVGIFSFGPGNTEPDYTPKATYNVLRMLNLLKREYLPFKLEDEFVGVIATKEEDKIVLIIYNYIDPEIANNFLSKNIAASSGGIRKIVLNYVKSGKLEEILQSGQDIASLRVHRKAKAVLAKTKKLYDKAQKFKTSGRQINITIKNFKIEGDYLYQRYVVNSACGLNCKFDPLEEKDINIAKLYKESLALEPFSVQMIILKKKPKKPENLPLPSIDAGILDEDTIKLPLENNRIEEKQKQDSVVIEETADTATLK